MSKTKVVITDYVEPNLDWEAKQFAQMGVDFGYNQLKFGTPQEILEFAAEADILIVNMAKIGAEVIDGLRRCKLIIRHGVGYDNVDVPSATRHGIVVATVPDYCVNEVAEQTVMLMMACQRKLVLQYRSLYRSAEDGSWDFSSILPIYSLHGKTVGIVGLGRIGGTVYQMLQGFGMKLIVCDPYLSEERRKKFGVELCRLEKLLPEADIITIHTPLNEETYHLFDEPQFKMMKKTAVLINTARGGIVNLRALDEALRRGDLAAAGIDVYEEREPPDPDFPLLHNERAICTPHLSWLSEESAWNIREKIVNDVQRFINGEMPRFPINANQVR